VEKRRTLRRMARGKKATQKRRAGERSPIMNAKKKRKKSAEEGAKLEKVLNHWEKGSKTAWTSPKHVPLHEKQQGV